MPLLVAHVLPAMKRTSRFAAIVSPYIDEKEFGHVSLGYAKLSHGSAKYISLDYGSLGIEQVGLSVQKAVNFLEDKLAYGNAGTLIVSNSVFKGSGFSIADIMLQAYVVLFRESKNNPQRFRRRQYVSPGSRPLEGLCDEIMEKYAPKMPVDINEVKLPQYH